MKKVKYLILGAGPAGLSFANRILENGEEDFLVLEKESEVGGLCRSSIVDDSPLDIGGGHFLDVRRPTVNDFLFGFMPEGEWNIYERDSRIQLDDFEVHHPLEANIWEMPENEQHQYLDSISKAGCNSGVEKPDRFTEWINWKLGERISNKYMLPYNRKMFGENLNELGTYWLEKLPNVSYEDTLKSCENHKAYGKQPGHASFYYPKKYGYGEVWKRMGERIADKLILGTRVVQMDAAQRIVSDSNGFSYKAEYIITTIPWNSFETVGYDEMDTANLKRLINELKHTGIEVSYVAENIDTDAHWIYVPDERKSYHRILVRHNFCAGSKGYWTETNLSRVDKSTRVNCSFISDYAYPLNTLNKPDVMDELLNYMRKNGVFGLGRWGEHQHYNSDVTVELAMKMADELFSATK